MLEGVDSRTMLTWLEWQVELGATEAIADTPLNRYEMPAARPVPASAPAAAEAGPDPVATAREAAVLAGLLPLLARQPRPPAILVELTPFSLALAGSTGRALVEALATLALPFWIVDHVAGRLAATDAEALATWCDNVAATAGDRGFMNILVGHAPAL